MSKRKIIWSQINDARSVTAFLIATTFGAGVSPVAPGTIGTIAGIPFAYLTQDWTLIYRVLFWIGLTGIGTWAAKVFDEKMKSSDNGHIVIDEVIGFGITAWTAGGSLVTWIAAFVLFRFFDILKPSPIRNLDNWSKKQASSWLCGFGVIADDVVAGFLGLGVILLLQWLHFL